MPLGPLQILKRVMQKSLYFGDRFLDAPKSLMGNPKASPRSPKAHFVWKGCRNRDVARKALERSLAAFGEAKGSFWDPLGEPLASKLCSRVGETLGHVENVHFNTIKLTT